MHTPTQARALAEPPVHPHNALHCTALHPPAPMKAPPATEARVPVHETPPLVPRGTGRRRRKEVTRRGEAGLRIPISEALCVSVWGFAVCVCWGMGVCGGEGGRQGSRAHHHHHHPPHAAQRPHAKARTHAPGVPVAAGVVADVRAQQAGAQWFGSEVEAPLVVRPEQPGVGGGDARGQHGAGQHLVVFSG